MTGFLDIRQLPDRPVTIYVHSWMWYCKECSWRGDSLDSEKAAVKEGAQHLWDEHQIAFCRPEEYGDPHDYQQMRLGSMWLDAKKCVRCGFAVGK